MINTATQGRGSMATFSLETLRIGPKNQLAGSDSLYDAFYKIKNNFSVLANANFSGALQAGNAINLTTNPVSGVITITNTGVTSLVAGSGITLSSSNGAVTVSANSSAGGSAINNGGSAVDIPVLNGNIVMSVGASSNVMIVSTDGVQIDGTVGIGNSQLRSSTLTTTSTTETSLVEIPVSNSSSGFSFLIKGIDSTGAKHSVHTVSAVTDGLTANYIVYGATWIGDNTGSFIVDLSGSTLRLRVTPVSSNSTLWTTQYQVI